MATLLMLFIVLAAIGAFDVGYYHLFRLRLFDLRDGDALASRR
jgi:hypothetical protein